MERQQLELLQEALAIATAGTAGGGDAAVAALDALDATSDEEGGVTGWQLLVGYALLVDALTTELARAHDITSGKVLEHVGMWAARGGEGAIFPT